MLSKILYLEENNLSTIDYEFLIHFNSDLIVYFSLKLFFILHYLPIYAILKHDYSYRSSQII